MPFDIPQAEPAPTRRSSRNRSATFGAAAAGNPATLNSTGAVTTEVAEAVSPAAPLSRRAARALLAATATGTVSTAEPAGAEAVAPEPVAAVEANAENIVPAAAIPAVAVAAVVATAAASRRAARVRLTEAAEVSVPELIEELAAAPAAIVLPEVVVEEIAPIVEPVEERIVDFDAEAAFTEPAAAEAPEPAAAGAPEPAEETASEPTEEPALERDAFAEASRTFGATAAASEPTVTPAPETEPVADLGVAASAHLAPRRGRKLRKIITAGASIGVMGVAGLLAVSMTLPAEAVAAVQGGKSSAITSLVTASEVGAEGKAANEIQAFVASSDVQNESLVRAEDFSTMSLVELAAEEGINYSNDLFTNDPDAAIQWPFKVGVAMSSGYGQRWGRLHAGIDLVPGAGAPIQAIADGVVREATESGGNYGVTAYIDHVIDGHVVTSHYSHMQYGSLRVKTGDTIKVGDIIGLVGNTGRSYGAHLHFEILVNGTTIDPLPWLRENAGRYEY